MKIPRVLSIAGSDSGGGAGIQADLKAFAACGVHGMTAITAITAQNTVAVRGVHHVPGEMIVAQVRAVVEDIGVDAVKIGMLGADATIEAVDAALDLIAPEVPVVLDPVMVAESGAELLERAARRTLVERLFPRVAVVTPNLPEARAILETVIATPAPDSSSSSTTAELTAASSTTITTAQPAASGLELQQATGDLARRIQALGPAVAVVTGGHRTVVVDVFCDGERCVEIPGTRAPDGAAHGSGCTHSSVLAARLALGDDPLSAARAAKRLAARSIAHGLRELGGGAGPVDLLLGGRERF